MRHNRARDVRLCRKRRGGFDVTHEDLLKRDASRNTVPAGGTRYVARSRFVLAIGPTIVGGSLRRSAWRWSDFAALSGCGEAPAEPSKEALWREKYEIESARPLLRDSLANGLVTKALDQDTPSSSGW